MPVKSQKKRTTGKAKTPAPSSPRSMGTSIPTQDDDNLLKEYTNFLETLDFQILRNKTARTKAIGELDEQEEEFLAHTYNKFSEEQLNTALPDFEKLLNESEPEIKANQSQNEDPKNDSKKQTFKLPMPRSKKKENVRRASFVNRYNTPVTSARIARPPPKFMSTGVKDSQPRPGYIGEFLYSENGSPVMIVDHPKLQMLRKMGETVPEDEV